MTGSFSKQVVPAINSETGETYNVLINYLSDNNTVNVSSTEDIIAPERCTFKKKGNNKLFTWNAIMDISEKLTHGSAALQLKVGDDKIISFYIGLNINKDENHLGINPDISVDYFKNTR